MLKNLLSLIRRHPTAILLNFAGLAGAWVAFSLIFLQADYELSFDRCHPTAERVFRVDKSGDESMFRNVLPRGFADDVIGASPHIEAGCNIHPFFGEHFFTVEEEGHELLGEKRTVVGVTGRLIDVFGIRMAEGDARALDRPGSVIIPRSLARTLFPDASALGKVLKMDGMRDLDDNLTITGVYEDFPANTQLGNDLYMALGDLNRGEYGAANYVCWLLLDEASTAGTVAGEFNAHFDFSRDAGWLSPIELTPLTQIYFLNEGNIYKSGSRAQLRLLMAVAVLILLLGLINFTNFYVALTPLRIRGIQLRKILGSSTGRLRVQLAAESVIWCLFAFGVAALLLGPVSEALLSRGVSSQAFSLRAHWGLLLFSGTVAVLTGVLAGIWPAFYSTSGEPAMTLRGNYGLSRSGKTLRAILVGMQFAVSMVLLFFVLFVQRQNRFMQEYPCGFDKEGLAVVNIGGEAEKNRELLRDRLRELPEVEDVAYSLEFVGGSDVYSTQTLNFEDGKVMMSMIFCSWNLPRVLGVELAEGRDFREGEAKMAMLWTENLKEHGVSFAEATSFLGASVAGLVKNVNITSMRKAEGPVAFVAVDETWDLPCAYIRLAAGADRLTAAGKIRSVLAGMDGAYPWEIRFYDSIGKTLYGGEERLRQSVALFSLLAVLLALVGVWGQVSMDVQYKRKEIAVKRVFGAEVRRITKEGWLLYMRSLVVCALIAVPLAWWVIDRWLRQFSHRVGLSPSVFLLAFALVAILVSSVVLYHYLRTVRTPPAEVLKNE